jgi:hypothetical protein
MARLSYAHMDHHADKLELAVFIGQLAVALHFFFIFLVLSGFLFHLLIRCLRFNLHLISFLRLRVFFLQFRLVLVSNLLHSLSSLFLLLLSELASLLAMDLFDHVLLDVQNIREIKTIVDLDVA